MSRAYTGLVVHRPEARRFAVGASLLLALLLPAISPGSSAAADSAPPVTTAQLNPPAPVGGAYTGPVTVTLSASDPPGPDTVTIAAVATSWEPQSATVTSGGQATWTFGATASFPHDIWLLPPGGNPNPSGGDLFEISNGLVFPGNGTVVSHTFNQDGVWQVICRLHASYDGTSASWSGQVGTLHVGHTEGGAEVSGVDHTEYRVTTNGLPGDWVTVPSTGSDPLLTQFTVVTIGEHLVEFRSVDGADNIEVMRQIEFEMAGPPPAAKISARTQPKKRKLKAGKRQTFVRVRIQNTGNLPAAAIKICAAAPKKRLRFRGGKCRTLYGLGPGGSARQKFPLNVRPAARGKTTKIVITVRAAGLKPVSATSRLRVKRAR